MNLCKGCLPGRTITTFNVDVNRSNLCQWVIGFVRAIWRREKQVTLHLHGSLQKVVVDGETVYSSDSATPEQQP